MDSRRTSAGISRARCSTASSRLLVVANTINIAADIAAMGEAMQLLVGGPPHVYAVLFGVVCLLLQVFLPYQRYVRYLKWLTWRCCRTSSWC